MKSLLCFKWAKSLTPTVRSRSSLIFLLVNFLFQGNYFQSQDVNLIENIKSCKFIIKFSNKDFYFKTNRKYSAITNGYKMNQYKAKRRN